MPTETTVGGVSGIKDPEIRGMLELMEKNTSEFGIRYFGFQDPDQGILHITPPEQGISQPGMVICGADSHTSTHGAFGSLAFGIGASEAGHIMATQCIWQQRTSRLRINIEGSFPFGVYAKDLILGLIAKFGVGLGVGTAIEFSGSCISNLTR